MVVRPDLDLTLRRVVGTVWILGPLLGIALAARLALAWFAEGNFDSASYNLVASIVHSGGNVYAETDRYNYSPFWFLILGALNPVAAGIHLPVANIARTLLCAVDIATAIVLYRMAGRVSASLFFLNPVSIAITGYHGAFDSIAVLLVLVALWNEMRGKLSAGWLIAAVVVKQTVAPALLFVPLRSRPQVWNRLGLAALAGLVLIATMIPWATSTRAVAGIGANVFAYALGIGDIGWGNVGPSFSIVPVVWRVGVYLALLALATQVIRLGWYRSALIWALLLVAASPATPEFYVLPLAIAALRPSWWLGAYSLIATLSYIGSPNEGLMPSPLTVFNGWPVAALTLSWAAWLVFSAYRRNALASGASNPVPSKNEISPANVRAHGP
jgi:hypothetical protein